MASQKQTELVRTQDPDHDDNSIAEGLVIIHKPSNTSLPKTVSVEE